MKLGVGWAAGMLLAVTVLSALFESHIYTVSSLFIGFIAGAALVLGMQMIKERSSPEFQESIENLRN